MLPAIYWEKVSAIAMETQQCISRLRVTSKPVALSSKGLRATRRSQVHVGKAKVRR